MTEKKTVNKAAPMPTDDPLRLLTLEDVARRMGVSVQFLRGEIKARRLRCRKVGRLIRFLETDLLEYLAHCRQ